MVLSAFADPWNIPADFDMSQALVEFKEEQTPPMENPRKTSDDQGLHFKMFGRQIPQMKEQSCGTCPRCTDDLHEGQACPGLSGQAPTR